MGRRQRLALLVLFLLASVRVAFAVELAIATFQADVTPPLGAPLCDGLVTPVVKVVDALTASGIVFQPVGEKPIVLCAVDWVGIGNEGHDAWREALASAVGTTSDRVCVHCLHQHDAPGCDFAAERLLADHGLSGAEFDVAFARKAIQHVAESAKEALNRSSKVTAVSVGRAVVVDVASTRRVAGPDGNVVASRMSSCRDPQLRDKPIGLIDPHVRVLGFWAGATPVASLTFYATHPQSYYGKGEVSDDFPGRARAIRERELPGVAHIHFNGAGGNITAGKFNDGSPENRPRLAARLADGMRLAWRDAKKIPIGDCPFVWSAAPVVLPARASIVEAVAKQTLADKQRKPNERVRAARDLAFVSRMRAGKPITLAALRIGPACFVSLPGETFIEYQLFAQTLRPEWEVLVAGYGDYGPGYIGAESAYSRGGYETSFVSRTAPEVELILHQSLRNLLP